MWYITVDGDQEAWQDFCESFMSEDIIISRHWHNQKIAVTCCIRIDPHKPIDSTGSMPSLIDRARMRGFQNIFVSEVV